MIRSVEATGKTIEDAINNAYRQLGLDRDSDEASVEVMQTPKSGFLGIGAVPAKVKLSVEEPDPIPEKKPEEKKPEPEQKQEKPAEAGDQSTRPEQKQPKQQKSQKQNRRGDKPQDKPEQKPQEEAAGEAAQPREKKERRDRQPKKERKEAEGENAEKKERRKETPPVILTAEEQEKVIADATAFLAGLLERMHTTAGTQMKFAEDGTLAIELVGDDLGMLIGRRGETLNAIQHITSYVVNKERNERIRVTVDVEGYREKREDALRKLAHKTALKVVRYRRNISLEPMNAYERHVIHTALQDWRDVTTFSSGSEPRRCVVISYTPGSGGGAKDAGSNAEGAPEGAEGEVRESKPRRDDRRGGRRGGRGGRGGNRGGGSREGAAPVERPKPKPLEETIWE